MNAIKAKWFLGGILFAIAVAAMLWYGMEPKGVNEPVKGSSRSGEERVVIIAESGVTDLYHAFLFRILTDTGGFSVYGYPTNYGPGINPIPASGGSENGDVVLFAVEVIATVPPGTYTGAFLIKDLSGNVLGEIPIKVIVR